VKQEFEQILAKSNHPQSLETVLDIEFQSKMVNDYLLTEDRMSMSHSVEERVPFLDKDLVEFAFSIPASMKMERGETKSLFRKSMKDILPESILNRPKWGFSVDPYIQFTKDLKSTATEILNEDFIKNQNIYNYDYIKSIIDARPHPKLRWHYNLLWMMTGLAIWQNMFIDSTDFIRGKKITVREVTH
jgi:asparagine synthase (glutamine-hydrolysing)